MQKDLSCSIFSFFLACWNCSIIEGGDVCNRCRDHIDEGKRCAWFYLWMLWYRNPDSVELRRWETETSFQFRWIGTSTCERLCDDYVFPIKYVINSLILPFFFWFVYHFYYWRPLFDRSPHTIPWQIFSFYTLLFFSNVFLEWIFVTIMSSITRPCQGAILIQQISFVYFPCSFFLSSSLKT